MPEEADWQRRARLAADALAQAKADARAKGYHPGAGGRSGTQRAGRNAPAPQDQAPEGEPAPPGGAGSPSGAWSCGAGASRPARCGPLRAPAPGW